jgi:hypothetical protein
MIRSLVGSANAQQRPRHKAINQLKSLIKFMKFISWNVQKATDKGKKGGNCWI